MIPLREILDRRKMIRKSDYCEVAFIEIGGRRYRKVKLYAGSGNHRRLVIEKYQAYDRNYNRWVDINPDGVTIDPSSNIKGSVENKLLVGKAINSDVIVDDSSLKGILKQIKEKCPKKIYDRTLEYIRDGYKPYKLQGNTIYFINADTGLKRSLNFGSEVELLYKALGRKLKNIKVGKIQSIDDVVEILEETKLRPQFEAYVRKNYTTFGKKDKIRNYGSIYIAYKLGLIQQLPHPDKWNLSSIDQDKIIKLVYNFLKQNHK